MHDEAPFEPLSMSSATMWKSGLYDEIRYHYTIYAGCGHAVAVGTTTVFTFYNN